MQIVLPPEIETIVQRQLTSGKYNSAIEVILAGVKLLEQQEDIYQGRLQELQQEALKGLEASQRGEVVDGATAIAQIRANMRSRYNSLEQKEELEEAYRQASLEFDPTWDATIADGLTDETW
jgi:antitoxin ParD1/3/4